MGSEAFEVGKGSFSVVDRVGGEAVGVVGGWVVDVGGEVGSVVGVVVEGSGVVGDVVDAGFVEVVGSVREVVGVVGLVELVESVESVDKDGAVVGEGEAVVGDV